MAWLAATVAAMVDSLTPAQVARSGYDDPARWGRMADRWRAALEGGQMTGTITPAGHGYAMHAHVFPLQPRKR